MADWNRIKDDKEVYRTVAASFPSAEKLDILDKLHERALSLRVGRGPITDGLREAEGRVYLISVPASYPSAGPSCVTAAYSSGVTASYPSAVHSLHTFG